MTQRQPFMMRDRETFADVLAHDHTEGPYCWLLNRVEKLDRPIPCNGALGLWDFKDSF